MKTVILTSGPRGAGKSTYSKKVKEDYLEVKYLSRDEIFIEAFGKTSFDRYTGDHLIARQIFEDKIKDALSEDDDFKIIIDCWNGFSSERKSLIKLFRELGADTIICWQFIVTTETCLKWFFKKDDSVGYSESGIRSDHRLYYKTATDIEDDGFDAVYRINPLQLSIPGLLF